MAESIPRTLREGLLVAGSRTEAKRSRLAKRMGGLVGVMLVGAAAWLSLLPATRESPVFGDEIGWITASSRTADLVLSGDFDWNHWNMESYQAYGPMNPPLGKLALGFPLRAGNSAPSFEGLWDWSLDEAANRERGNLPASDLFLAARRTAATHAAALVVVVGILGWAMGGLATGLIAAGLLCIHPTWRDTAPLVLTDMLLVAVLVSMAFPAIRLLRRPHRDLALGPLVWLGLLMGTAAAIKPTGLILGCLCLLSVQAFRSLRSRTIASPFFGTLAAAAISAVTLVALDPWLWPDVRQAGPSELLRECPVVVDALQSPNPLATLEARRKAFPSIHAIARPAWIFVRAMHWKHLVGHQKSLPSLQWEAVRPVVLGKWILVGLVSFPGQMLFVLLGVWGAFRERDEGGTIAVPSLVVLLFTLATFVYVFALVVIPVPRYLLPLFALQQVLSAQGLLFALRHGAGFVRARVAKR